MTCRLQTQQVVQHFCAQPWCGCPCLRPIKITHCAAHCRDKERIAFNYLTSQKFSGEQAVVEVWREGREVQLTIQLMQPRLLVPLHLANKDPSFFVVAG